MTPFPLIGLRCLWGQVFLRGDGGVGGKRERHLLVVAVVVDLLVVVGFELRWGGQRKSRRGGGWWVWSGEGGRIWKKQKI